MARIQATLIHLIISVIIFIILAGLIYYYLYPGALFFTDGGIQGMQIIAGIDIIAGPMLTLFVYKKGKKKLKQDLALISLIQIIFLGIGCYHVYKERPISVVYTNGKYHTMSKLSYKLLHKDYNQLPKINLLSPNWYYVPLSEDAAERSNQITGQLKQGPLHSQIDKYIAYEKHIPAIIRSNLDIHKNVDLAEADIKANQFVSFIAARHRNGYILVERNTGKLIKLLNK